MKKGSKNIFTLIELLYAFIKNMEYISVEKVEKSPSLPAASNSRELASVSGYGYGYNYMGLDPNFHPLIRRHNSHERVSRELRRAYNWDNTDTKGNWCKFR